MRRINQQWPDGLFERVQQAAGARGVTDYTVAAVELALTSETHPSQQRPVASLAEEPRQAPQQTEPVLRTPAPQTFKCPNDCTNFRPHSPKLRCPVCRHQVVPT